MDEPNVSIGMPTEAKRDRTIFIVAGEESGDRLGAELMSALLAADPNLRIVGIGGGEMTGRGLKSLFPMSDIAVMGFTAVFRRLPLLLRRIRETAKAVADVAPDILVIIDSPDFTHRVAKRVRRRSPNIPIVNYVSPTVWVWRPGRARKMTRYVDHLMAILPFEPDVHKRLGGPQCTYVGHPLVEKRDQLRPAEGERRTLGQGAPVLLVLPGSRRMEIQRLADTFGAALSRLSEEIGPLEAILPTVPHLRAELETAVKNWPVKPEIVVGETAKYEAFRRAHAALAASGTVTLELGLAEVPMCVAYKVEWPIRALKGINPLLGRPIKLDTIVLVNIILGSNVIPEFLDEDVTVETLVSTTAPLLQPGPERQKQIEAFKRLDTLMALPDGMTPSKRAASIVLGTMKKAG